MSQNKVGSVANMNILNYDKTFSKNHLIFTAVAKQQKETYQIIPICKDLMI